MMRWTFGIVVAILQFINTYGVNKHSLDRAIMMTTLVLICMNILYVIIRYLVLPIINKWQVSENDGILSDSISALIVLVVANFFV